MDVNMSLDDVIKMKSISKIPKVKHHSGAGKAGEGTSRNKRHHKKNHHKSQKTERSTSHQPKKSSSIESSKIIVSNLADTVSQGDVEELFTEFGRLRHCALHYDQFSKSLGTAEVNFAFPSDAARAVKQYNGVPLDGKAMNIQFAVSQAAIPRIKVPLPFLTSINEFPRAHFTDSWATVTRGMTPL